MELAPMEVAPAAGGIFACIFSLIFGLIFLAATAFWIWMIIDVVTRCPSEDNKKLTWVLVVALTWIVGALIYFFVQRPKNPPAGVPAAPPGPPPGPPPQPPAGT